MQKVYHTPLIHLISLLFFHSFIFILLFFLILKWNITKKRNEENQSLWISYVYATVVKCNNHILILIYIFVFRFVCVCVYIRTYAYTYKRRSFRVLYCFSQQTCSFSESISNKIIRMGKILKTNKVLNMTECLNSGLVQIRR